MHFSSLLTTPLLLLLLSTCLQFSTSEPPPPLTTTTTPTTQQFEWVYFDLDPSCELYVARYGPAAKVVSVVASLSEAVAVPEKLKPEDFGVPLEVDPVDALDMWSTHVERHFGSEWHLRVFLDSKEMFHRIKQLVQNENAAKDGVGEKVLQVLARAALKRNVEVWVGTCHAIVPEVLKSHHEFSKVMRWFPMFDPSVSVAALRDLSLLEFTDDQDANIVKSWVAEPSTNPQHPFLAYILDHSKARNPPVFLPECPLSPTRQSETIFEHSACSGSTAFMTKQNIQQIQGFSEPSTVLSLLDPGMFGGKKITPDAHRILPDIAWHLMVKVLEMCTPLPRLDGSEAPTVFGRDYIVLNYVLKYVPRLYRMFLGVRDLPSTTKAHSTVAGEEEEPLIVEDSTDVSKPTATQQFLTSLFKYNHAYLPSAPIPIGNIEDIPDVDTTNILIYPFIDTFEQLDLSFTQLTGLQIREILQPVEGWVCATEESSGVSVCEVGVESAGVTYLQEGSGEMFKCKACYVGGVLEQKNKVCQTFNYLERYEVLMACSTKTVHNKISFLLSLFPTILDKLTNSTSTSTSTSTPNLLKMKACYQNKFLEYVRIDNPIDSGFIFNSSAKRRWPIPNTSSLKCGPEKYPNAEEEKQTLYQELLVTYFNSFIFSNRRQLGGPGEKLLDAQKFWRKWQQISGKVMQKLAKGNAPKEFEEHSRLASRRQYQGVLAPEAMTTTNTTATTQTTATTTATAELSSSSPFRVLSGGEAVRQDQGMDLEKHGHGLETEGGVVVGGDGDDEGDDFV